jgi:mono/diheme cytochrome c family protein
MTMATAGLISPIMHFVPLEEQSRVIPGLGSLNSRNLASVPIPIDLRASTHAKWSQFTTRDWHSCQHDVAPIACAMRKRFTAVLCASLVAVALVLNLSFRVRASSSLPSLMSRAHSQRLSATDLSISGDLAGLAPGSTRYLSREDLLTLPQVTYTVSDDQNFAAPTEIAGVVLEELERALAGDPGADLIVAISDDRYHAHYWHGYLAEHHPLLVLKVNGQPPGSWPKDAEGHGLAMGPYMISHRQFVSRKQTASPQEQAQIPWGVIGLEFHNEREFLASIAPPRNASDPGVQLGFRLAQENCLRCHDRGGAGGQKARHPWLVLSAWAMASPEHFTAYVHNPPSENPQAEMPASPYDKAALQALLAYFQTFQAPEKP